MPEFLAPDAHAEFQYESPAHAHSTSVDGMWLFLASEALFFGGLFLIWVVYRHWHPVGFAAATHEAEVTLGSVNTAILVTSSFVYSTGVSRAKLGDNRGVLLACAITMVLGMSFLALKGLEWHQDVEHGLWPGVNFSIQGPDRGGAQLFWIFYWIATGLHGLHLTVGILLVGWVAWNAWRQSYSRAHYTGVEVVGLYWSFVDMVWLILYPLIYLEGGRG